MSLTSFVQRPDVRLLFRQHVQISRVKFPERPVCEPLTTHYGLVGTAFDYLCRFCLQRHYPHAIVRHWVAEETLSLLMAHSVFVEAAEAIFDLAQQIVRAAKEQETRYLKEGLLTEALLSSCLLLAQLDPLYRSGMLYESFGKIDPRDLQDMQQLGRALLHTGMAQLVSQEVCLLNPVFGASSLVGGADTDLILDHCLIDIKTTKWLKFSRRRREESQSFLGTGGEMAPGCGDVGGARAMDEGDSQIAQGSQNLRGVARAQAGAVFLKTDIAHMMGAVFDTPMATIEFQQALGTRLGGREGRDR